jgi:hypothetical protein
MSKRNIESPGRKGDVTPGKSPYGGRQGTLASPTRTGMSGGSKVMTEGQALTNMNDAYEEFDNQITDIVKRSPDNYPEYADPLSYKAPEYETTDWNEVPIIAAEFILHIQHHHNTVVDYLCNQNKLETTGDLRSGVENRMEIADKVMEAQKV